LKAKDLGGEKHVNSTPNLSQTSLDATSSIVVSVVIPTWNRKDLLTEVLESLARQTYPVEKYEIIVCDDGSTDGTAEMIADFKKSFAGTLVYHRMPQNCGPAKCRNVAVGIARGHLIAFTDSDCRVSPDWLALGVSAFASERVAIATGTIFHKPEQQVTYFSRSHDAVTQEHPSYPAQNAMFRKSVFLQFGGFEETLCFRNFRNRQVECADTDLAWRIKEGGFDTVFVKDMVVYHEIESQTAVNWVLEPFRLFVVPALVKRHPGLRPRLLRWHLFMTALNIPFYLLAAGVLAALVFRSPWFLLCSLPYFFYTARACRRRYSFSTAKMAGWLVLMTFRQAFGCAGLLYGSIRFRELVL
jgi:glycosyltransferase involved in cell wall biosynthesis